MSYDPLSVDQACRELALWLYSGGLLYRAQSDGYGQSEELMKWLRATAAEDEQTTDADEDEPEQAVGDLAGKDILDSRDVIARIEELEGTLDSLECNSEALLELADTWRDDQGEREGRDALFEARETYLSEHGADESTELRQLRALQDEAQCSPDWTYGETLILDSYFQDYAQELADDIGATPKEGGWPDTCIDWEEAADQLKQDYMRVSYGNLEYWIRA